MSGLILFKQNIFLKEYQSHMYEHTSGSNRFQCTECPYNCKNYSKLKVELIFKLIIFIK